MNTVKSAITVMIDDLLNKTLVYCNENKYDFKLQHHDYGRGSEVTINANSTEEYESVYLYFYLDRIEDLGKLEELMQAPIERKTKQKEVA